MDVGRRRAGSAGGLPRRARRPCPRRDHARWWAAGGAGPRGLRRRRAGVGRPGPGAGPLAQPPARRPLVLARARPAAAAVRPGHAHGLARPGPVGALGRRRPRAAGARAGAAAGLPLLAAVGGDVHGRRARRVVGHAHRHEPVGFPGAVRLRPAPLSHRRHPPGRRRGARAAGRPPARRRRPGTAGRGAGERWLLGPSRRRGPGRDGHGARARRRRAGPRGPARARPVGNALGRRGFPLVPGLHRGHPRARPAAPWARGRAHDVPPRTRWPAAATS